MEQCEMTGLTNHEGSSQSSPPETILRTSTERSQVSGEAGPRGVGNSLSIKKMVTEDTAMSGKRAPQGKSPKLVG